jgi:hypothetical protein
MADVSVADFKSAVTTGTPIQVPALTGLAVGDLIVSFAWNVTSSESAIGGPAGWSQYLNFNGGSSSSWAMSVYTKIATSTEVAAGTYDFTNPGGTAHVCAYRIINHGGLISGNLANSAQDNDSGTYSTSGTINVRRPKSLIIMSAGGTGSSVSGSAMSGFQVTGGASVTFGSPRVAWAPSAAFRLEIVDGLYDSTSPITAAQYTLSTAYTYVQQVVLAIPSFPGPLNVSAHGPTSAYRIENVDGVSVQSFKTINTIT